MPNTFVVRTLIAASLLSPSFAATCAAQTNTLPLPSFSASLDPARLHASLDAKLDASPDASLAPAAPARASALAQNYGKLPQSFEANQGQTDPRVKFTSSGSGYSLFLTGSSAVLSLTKAAETVQPRLGLYSPRDAMQQVRAPGKTDVVRMELVRANPSARVSGADQLPGTANYLIGNNPANWHANVPTYAKVRYSGVYDGIDLVYYGNQGQLEYDFVVAPQADPKAIRLHFAGASKLSLTADGDLSIQAENGQIAFHRPVVYQEIDGQRLSVPGQFTRLASRDVSFSLGSYDHKRPLIIDPVLAYSTYLGGTKGDGAGGVAVDSEGNAYIAGSTNSSNFPVTEGVYQAKNISNTSKAFITKLNPTGTALIYSTYLGGSGNDGAGPIALDSSGDVYVGGSTSSANFPVTQGAYLTTNVGGGFVAKLNPAGTGLLYSTYFGAGVGGLAIDGSGAVYLAGSTSSSTFPVTAGALRTTFVPNESAFAIGYVSKLSPSGAALVYSTYLGGSGGLGLVSDGGDFVRAIAVDSGGNAYVTGFTFSVDFPVTPGAFQTKDNEDQTWTGYVSKLNPTGTGLVYSTYLGGSGSGDNGEFVNGIALDSAGDAYVAGETWSPDFPTANAFESVNPAFVFCIPIFGYNWQQCEQNVGLFGSSGFVTKLNPAGSALVYSTFLGGTPPSQDQVQNSGDAAGSIAVDSAGNAYVTGAAQSTDFPVTPGAFQVTNNNAISGNNTGFVTEFDPNGALLYATYLGGTTSDAIGAITVDGAQNAYVAGSANSNNFPVTPGAFQTYMKNPSQGTAFVAKLDLNSPPSTVATTTTITSSANPQSPGLPITFTASVVGSDGTPQTDGEIIFSVDGVHAATEPLTGVSTAAFSSSTLLGGSHSIQAIFSGNPTYTVSNTTLTETIAGQPAISPASGKYIGPIQVSITGAVPGATIRYTLDGSIPTTSSPAYSGSFTLDAGHSVVSAVAFIGASPASAITQATYTSVPVTPTPVIGPTPGIYPGGVPLPVTITDADANATIRYTTDGSTPNAKSIWYHQPINVTSSETITAIAISSEGSSPAVSAAYAVLTPEPTLSPAPGKYTGSVVVTLGEIDSSAIVHYTLNGGAPGPTTSVSTGQITLSAGYTVLRAVAIDPAYPPSPTVEGAYTVLAQNPPPVFTPAPGPYAPGQTVTITDAVAATIRYTTDGSTPTSKSTIYSKPIALSGTETIQAIATGTSNATSNVASGTYTPE
jgi:hypothetical protein